MSIVKIILSLIDKFLSWFKSKEDRAAAKEKILQEERFRKAEEKKREIERIDSHEKLVKDVSDKEKKDAALKEIRIRLGK